jgi:hypothetical protein
MIEKGIEIGIDDVGQTGKNTHGSLSFFIVSLSSLGLVYRALFTSPLVLAAAAIAIAAALPGRPCLVGAVAVGACQKPGHAIGFGLQAIGAGKGGPHMCQDIH